MTHIAKLAPLTPLRDCEVEALFDLIPLAQERLLHGDEEAKAALDWMNRVLAERAKP